MSHQFHEYFAYNSGNAADEHLFRGHGYHASMWASGPGSDGPSTAMAIGVGVGAVALVGGLMYLLGGKPETPTYESTKKGLGFGATRESKLDWSELHDLARPYSPTQIRHNCVYFGNRQKAQDFSDHALHQGYDAQNPKSVPTGGWVVELCEA